MLSKKTDNSPLSLWCIGQRDSLPRWPGLAADLGCGGRCSGLQPVLMDKTDFFLLSTRLGYLALSLCSSPRAGAGFHCSCIIHFPRKARGASDQSVRSLLVFCPQPRCPVIPLGEWACCSPSPYWVGSRKGLLITAGAVRNNRH